MQSRAPDPVNTLDPPLKLVNITKAVLSPRKGVAASHFHPLTQV